MSRMMTAAAAAVLALAPFSSTMAQEAPAAVAQPPAPTAAPAMNPADQALQDQGTAFEAETRQMGLEIQAVMEDEALDKATKTERTDAILDRYQPRFEAFAQVLEAYLIELAGRPENSAHRDDILASAETVPAQLTNAPAALRASIQQALNAPVAPPADTPQ